MLGLEYDFDSQGRITSPGKFEGEMLYVPYFFDVSLEGLSDVLADGTISVEIMDEDVVHFAERRDEERDPVRIVGLTKVVKILRGRKRRVRLYETGDGFVCER
jgi:hypothetical protein